MDMSNQDHIGDSVVLGFDIDEYLEAISNVREDTKLKKIEHISSRVEKSQVEDEREKVVDRALAIHEDSLA